MNDSNIGNESSEGRQAALSALAVVGFLALVALGIWLAISAARYVPSTVSKIGSAAVALSSLFSPASAPASDATSTPAANASSTASTTTSTASTTTAAKTGGTATTPGQETSGTYPIGAGASSSGTLSGLPDLAVTISAVGYLTTNTTDSFVAGANVPSGERPAVKFTVKNIGTNIAGQWIFMASIPTTNGYVYTSLPQQSLNPGDSIDYTLGFDSAAVGSGKTITITINSDHRVLESDYSNDVATAVVNVQ